MGITINEAARSIEILTNAKIKTDEAMKMIIDKDMLKDLRVSDEECICGLAQVILHETKEIKDDSKKIAN